MKNLLLIDSRILDISNILSSLTETTDYLVFSYDIDTYASLKTAILDMDPTNSYQDIGIIQHNFYQPVFSFLKSESDCILSNIQIEDPTLQSWTDFIDFLGWLKTDENSHIDILACDIWNNSDWVYAIQPIRENYGIYIRASVDITGYGGDFILESDNVDTIGVYFTSDILNYRYTFGGTNPPTGFVIYRAIRRPTSSTIGNVVLDVSYSLGGYALTGFKYSIDGTTFQSVTTQNTTTNVTVAGLMNTVGYNLYLQVLSTGGDVSAAIVLPRVDPSSVPYAPTINSVTYDGTNVTVSFNEPKFDGGTDISGYTYDLSSSTTVTTNNAISVTLSAFSPYTFNIAGLTAGNYGIKLYANNQNSASKYSATNIIVPVPSKLSKLYRFDVGDLSFQSLGNYATGSQVLDASLSHTYMINSSDPKVGTGSLRLTDTSLNFVTMKNVMKYPEFTMTSNSSVNYVASASTQYSTNLQPYKAFDNSNIDFADNANSRFYHSAWDTYRVSDGAYVGSVSTTVGGTSYSGEWLQIQFPAATNILSYAITSRPAYETTQSPNTWIIAGSNNGSTWSLIDTRTSITTWSSTNTRIFFNMTTPGQYSYYRMICSVVGSANDAGNNRKAFVVGEWELFTVDNPGMSTAFWLKSNSTSSYSQILDLGNGPGQDNITMSVLSNQLYVTTVSGPINTATVTFDPSTNPWGTTTTAASDTPGSTISVAPDDNIAFSISEDGMRLVTTTLTYGSVYFSQYNPLSSSWSSFKRTYASGALNTNNFSIRLVKNGNMGLVGRDSGGYYFKWINDLSNYSSLIPFITGSSYRGLDATPDGKRVVIARFDINHVYYTDLKTYDISAITSGTFSSITSNTPNITGNTTELFRNGTYNVSSSNSSITAYNVFDNSSATIWSSGGYSSGIYTGINTTTINNSGSLSTISGEWIQIKLPYPFVLNRFELNGNSSNTNSYPKNFYILGSNEGSKWYQINYISNDSNATNTLKTYSISSNTTEYFYYRLLCTNTVNDLSVNLSQFYLYGKITTYDPSLVQITSTARNYIGVAISRDKRIVVYNSDDNMVRYMTWNGTSYANEGQIGETVSSPRVLKLSYDDSILFCSTEFFGMYYAYRTADLSFGGFTQVSTSIVPTTGNSYWGFDVLPDNTLYFSSHNPGKYYISKTKMNLTNYYSNYLNLTPVVPSFNDNTWRHITWTVDPSGIQSYYVNGTLAYPSDTYFLFKNPTASTYSGQVSPLPSAFSTSSVTITGQTGANILRNGTYDVSASSYFSTYREWVPFNTASDTYPFWHSQFKYENSVYDQYPYSPNPDGIYEGGGAGFFWTTNVFVSGTLTTISGEWIQIKLPNKLKLSSYTINLGHNVSWNKWNMRGYRKFTLAGSNDGSTWYSVDRQTITSAGTETFKTFSVSSANSYYYFRVIIEAVYVSEATAPYRGIAHMGQLTLNGDFSIYTTNNNNISSINNENSVTLYNDPIRGNSFNFNGSNQLSIPSLTTPTQFTKMAWIYANNVTGLSYIFDSSRSLSLYRDVSNIKCSLNNSSIITSNTIIASNTWVHTTVTYNGSILTLYVNGVSAGTLNYTGYTGDVNNSLYIGADYTGLNNKWNGYLDDIRQYNRALTVTDISTIIMNPAYRNSIVPSSVTRTKSYIGKSSNNPELYTNANIDDFRIYQRAVTATDVSNIIYRNIVTVASTNVPNPPVITRIDSSNTSLIVYFTVDTNGGLAITNVSYSLNNPTGPFTSAETANSPFTITGLTPYSTNRISITATSSTGTSDVYTQTLYTGPSTPTVYRAIRRPIVGTTGSVVVDISYLTYGYSITGYQYSIDGGVTYSAVTSNASTTNVTVDGLTNTTAYTMYLRLKSAGTDATSSAIVLPRVDPSSVPYAPTINSVTYDVSTAYISFNEPKFDGGSDISGYTYDLSSSISVSTNNAIAVNLASFSPYIFSIRNVIGGVYTLKIYANNKNGSSKYSAAIIYLNSTTYSSFLKYYTFEQSDVSELNLYNNANYGRVLDASLSHSYIVSTSNYVYGSGSLQLMDTSKNFVKMNDVSGIDVSGMSMSFFLKSNSNSELTPIIDLGSGRGRNNITLSIAGNNLVSSILVGNSNAGLITFDASSTPLPAMPSDGGNKVQSVSISKDSKYAVVLMETSGHLFYSTYTTSWSTFARTLATGDISNVNNVVLNSTGSRGVLNVYRGYCYYFTWNGSNYTLLTQTSDTATRSYTNIDLTPNGNRMVVSVFNDKIYYADWNGSNYSTLTVIATTPSLGYSAVAITVDSNTVAYSTYDLSMYVMTWNGTNYANETAITNHGGLNTTPMITNGLKFYYNLTGLSGDTVGNSIVNYATGSRDASYNSSTVNTVTTDYRIKNSTINFGVNATDYITLPPHTITTGGLTYSLWVKGINTYTNSRIYAYSGTGDNTIALAMNSKSLINFVVINGTFVSNTYTAIAPSSIDINNKWTHITWTMTYSSSNTSTWNIYANGSLVSTNTNCYYPVNMSRPIHYIGKSEYTSDPSFNGYINNFMVYDRVLTLDEVDQLYNYTRNLKFSVDSNLLYRVTNRLNYYVYNPTTTNYDLSGYLTRNNGILDSNGIDVGVDHSIYLASRNLNAVVKTKLNRSNYTTASYFSNTNINNNTWRNIAWTVNATGVHNYYIDGSSVYSYSTNSSLVPNKTIRGNSYIGTSTNLPNSYFKGGMDNLYILKIPMAASDVRDLCNNVSVFSYTNVPNPPVITRIDSSNASIIVYFNTDLNSGSAITSTNYSTNGTTGPFTSIETGTSPITIPGLTNGTTYSVSLTATSANGTSSPSDTFPGTPYSSPSAPTVTITSGITKLDVSFVAVTYGLPTTYYYNISGESAQTTTSPFSITGLSGGYTYYIYIRASNIYGYSPYTITSGIPYDVPGAPTVVLSTPAKKQIDISFSDLSANGSPITNYYYNISGGVDVSMGLNTYSVTNLSGGYTYTIYVKAFNLAGNSTYTIQSITPYDIPTPPGSLTLTPKLKSFDVSFGAFIPNGSTITNYYYDISGVVDGSNLNITQSPINIPGLVGGTSYTIRVYAKNTAGNSAKVIATSIPYDVPSAPIILSTTAGINTVDVSFSASQPNGSTITGYYYNVSGGSTGLLGTVPGTYTITGLNPNTTYTIYIYATNAGGNSPNAIINTTLYGLPDAPSFLTLIGKNKGFDISFGPSPVDPGYPVLNYYYTISGDTTEYDIGNTLVTYSVNSFNGQALTDGTLYYVKLRSRNFGGYSSYAMGSVYTYEPKPSIQYILPVDSQLYIYFSQSLTSNSSVTNYNYSIDGGATFTPFSPAQASSPVIISGLKNQVKYNVSINGNTTITNINASDVSSGTPDGSAITSSLNSNSAYQVTMISTGTFGNSIVSMPYTYTYKTPPSQPGSVTVTPGDKESLISFSTPTNNGGLPILGYKYSFDTTTYIDVPYQAYDVMDTSNISVYYILNTEHLTAETAIKNIATSAYDASLIDMSINNAVGSSKIGKSYGVFNGTSSRISTSSSAASSFTISCWVYLLQNSGKQTVASCIDASGGWILQMDCSAGFLEMLYGFGSGPAALVSGGYGNNTGYYTTRITNLSILYNKWTHISVTYENSTSKMQSYINGSYINTDTISTNSFGTIYRYKTYSPNANLSIGALNNAGTLSNYLTAGSRINLFASYKRPLTSTEIVNSVNCLTTNFVISSLTNGLQYPFYLKAVNQAGDSDFISTPSAFTPASSNMPSSPFIYDIRPGNGTLVVYFTPPYTNGGIIITDYKYRLNGGVFQSAGTVNPFTISGLTNGSVYSVTIVATNANGNSISSNNFVATPVVSPVSLSPTIQTVEVGFKSLYVYFTENSAPFANSYITGYKYSLNGGAYVFTSQTNSPIVIQNVTEGSAYTANLITSYNIGDSSPSSGVTSQYIVYSDTTPSISDPPTSLIAIPRSDSQVDVSFITPANTGGASILGYKYQINGSDYIYLSSTTIPYVFTGLTKGTSYTFVLKTVTQAGDSVASSSVSATTFTNSSAPVIVQIVRGYQLLDVSFTQGSTGGSSVTGYKYSTDGGSTYTSTSTTTSPLRITGLADQTSYTITLIAVNSVGDSSASSAVIQTTFGYAGAPVISQVISGKQYLDISFSQGDTGGTSVTNYKYSTNGTTYIAFSPSSITSPLRISGLTDGVSYSVSIKAVNIVGDSSASNAVSQYTFSIPDQPKDLSAIATNQSARILFTPPTFTGRTPITSYEYKLTVNGVTGSYISTGSLDNSFNITPANLTNGSTYTIIVRANNTVGNSIDSSSTTFVPYTIPTAPTINSISPKNTVAYVVFTPNFNGGNTVTRYEYALDAGSTYTNTGSLDTSFNITGLTNGTSYIVRLRAVNNAGASSDVSATVVPSTVPDKPVIVDISENNASAFVSFSPPAWNGGNTITKFSYSINNWSSFVDISNTYVNFTLFDLSNGYPYTLRMRAYNYQGYSTDASRNFTPARIPDSPIIGVIELSNQLVNVNFTAPVFNGGNAITKYTYSTNNWVSSTDLINTTTRFTISSLTNGNLYTLLMRAHNAKGYSTDASSSFIPCTVPNAPTISAVDVSNQKVTFTIAKPAESGGNAVSKMAYTINNWTTSTDISDPNTTTIVLTGLTNGTLYTFKLRAYNIQGASTDATTTFTPSTNPDPPSITDISENDVSAFISFSAPINTGGNAISKYNYTIFNNSTLAYATSGELMSTARNFNITSLINGTSYTVRLKAFNIQGSSIDASRNFIPSRIPDKPTIDVIDLSNRKVIVNFTAGYNGGNAITKHTYNISDTVNGWNSPTVDLDKAATIFTISDVSNGTKYILYMRTFNTRGVSQDASSSFIPRTVPDSPPITDISENDQSAFVSFNAPYEGGNAIVNYRYSINNWLTSTNVLSNARNFNITDLSNGVAYVVRLRAYNSQGFSADSYRNFIPSRIPDPPTIVDLSENDQSAFVTIRSNYNGGNALTKYRYTINNWSSYVDLSSDTTNFNITSLTNGRSYVLGLTLFNLRGNTAPVTRSFIPSTVPTAPIITTITPDNKSGKVIFTPSDNSGGNTIIRYEYYRTDNSNYVTVPVNDTSFNITDLSNGVAYTVYLRAVNLRGPSPSSTFTFFPRTAPSAPTINSVTLGNKSAFVVFSPPTNTGGSVITQYEYSLNNWQYTFIVSAADTSFNVTKSNATTDISNGTSYLLQLRAVNEGGSSGIATTSFVPRTVPDAPSIGFVVLGDTQVRVTFAPPTNDGGNSIVKYEYSLSSSWSSPRDIPVADSSFTITGLTNGTQSTVYLRAYNSAGYGANVSTQFIPRRIPDPFAGLTITKGDTNIQFTIDFGAGYSNGGNAITNYEYRLDNGSYNNILLNSTYTITSLTNGQYYILYVRAINAAGPSPDISAITYPRTIPNAPTITNVTLNDKYGVVYFNTPDSSGGAVITNYDYTLDSVNYTTIGGAGLTNQYFTISTYNGSNLNNGTEYTVKMRAQNEAGFSALSSAYTFIPRRIPYAPSISDITLKNRSVDFSLTAPISNGGNAITNYEYVLDAGTVYTNMGNTLQYTIADLSNGQYYLIRVRARNAAGPSPDVSSSFIPRTVPSAPTISSYTLNDRSVMIVFVASDSSGGNTITNYEYSINNWANSTNISVNDTYFNITDISNGVTYIVKLRARNAAGVSIDASQSVIPRTIPTRPTITSINQNDRSAIVYYNPSDSSGGNAIVRYEYVLDGGSSYTNVGIDVSFNITGLNNGQSYIVRLRSVNAAGFSPDISTSFVPRTVPSAPTITSYDENDRSVIVNFTPSASNGGNAIIKYGYTLNNWALTTDVSANVTQFTVPDLTNGASYILKYRAYNDEGYSPDVSIAFIPRTNPDPPTFSSILLRNAGVDINYNLSVSNGGNAIVRYEYVLDDNSSYINIGLTGGFSISALNNGERYLVRLRAVNVEGPSIDVSTIVIPRTIPSAPIISDIDENSESAIVYFNTPASNGGNAITRYEYVLDNNTSYTPVGLVNSFTIIGLTNGQSYILRMRAVNDEGVSVDASRNFIPRTVPNPPTITSIDQNNQSAIIYFSAPPASGGSPVTKYFYTLDDTNDPNTIYFDLSTLDASKLDLSFNLPSYGGQPLLNGTSYTVRMRARNAEGHSIDASKSFIPRTVPTSPTISSIQTGNQTVSITYHASNNNGGNTIIDYRYKLSSVNGTTSYISIGQTNSFNIINLSNGVEYTIVIVAVNDEGFSADSVSNKFTPFTIATAPSITSITEGNQRVTFQFSAPSDSGGSPITGYKYSLSTDGASGYVNLSYTVSGSVYTGIIQNVGLQNGTQSPLIIAAVNAGGLSTSSSIYYFTPYTVPDIPTITSITPGSTIATVYYSGGFNGGDTITSYTYSKDGVNYYIINNSNHTMNPFTITGLTNGTLYPITIKAFNRAGASVASSIVEVRPRTVPNTPTIDYLVPGNSSITVHFIASSFNGGEPVTNYSYNTGEGEKLMNTTTSPYTITGLTNGTSYSVVIKEINVAGSSAPSNTITAVPFTNPFNPTNVVLTASLESIIVNFTAPSYTGGYPISNYIYSINNGVDTFANTTSTQFTITGLMKGTSYQIKLKSVTVVAQSINYSAISNSVIAYGASSPPTITSIVYGDKSAILSYTAPPFQGGDSNINILYYKYSLNDGAYVDIGLNNPYTIINLTNGLFYKIVMRAVNIAGDSADSNSEFFTPRTIPNAPIINSVVPSANSLIIRYSSTFNGGASLLKYMYSLNSTSLSSFVDTPVTSPITPITVTGLENGTSYLVRLLAVNEVGNSLIATALYSAIPYSVPDAPIIVSHLPSDGRELFNIATPFDGGRSLLGYRYSAVPEVTSGIEVDTVSGVLEPATTQFYANDLSNGFFYNLSIEAYNIAGYSIAATSRFLAGATPFAPVITNATGGINSITIEFDIPFDGGSPIIGTRYSLNGGSFIEAGTTVSPINITRLLRGDYTVQIVVYNERGTSPPAITQVNVTNPQINTVFFTSNTARDGASRIERLKTDAAGVYSYYGGSVPLSIIGKPKSSASTHTDNRIISNSRGRSIGRVSYKPTTNNNT